MERGRCRSSGVWSGEGVEDGRLGRAPKEGTNSRPTLLSESLFSVTLEPRGALRAVLRSLAEPGHEKLRRNLCVAAFAERTIASLSCSSTKSWMPSTVVRGRRKLFSSAATVATCAT